LWSFPKILQIFTIDFKDFSGGWIITVDFKRAFPKHAKGVVHFHRETPSDDAY
jgi:hypothetical protein